MNCLGEKERQQCYQPVRDIINKEFASLSPAERANIKIVVPGML